MIASLLQFIQSLDPKTVYTAISTLTFGIIYLWRKFSYSTWTAVTRRQPLLEDLPAIVLSGLMSVAPALNRSFWPALWHILFGALFGGGTTIWAHHALKDSAIPYNGGQPKAPPPSTIIGGKAP